MNDTEIDHVLTSLSDAELGRATREALQDLARVKGANRKHAVLMFFGNLNAAFKYLMAERRADMAPCPFCGSPAELAQKGPLGHKPRCTSCDAELSCKRSPQDAIAAWNKRAAP